MGGVKNYMKVMGMVNSIVINSRMPLIALGIFPKAILNLEENMMFFGMKSNDYHVNKIIQNSDFYCTQA